MPAGAYDLLFIHGDARVRREGVDVGVGRTTVVNARTDGARSEVVTIVEKAPAT